MMLKEKIIILAFVLSNAFLVASGAQAQSLLEGEDDFEIELTDDFEIELDAEEMDNWSSAIEQIALFFLTIGIESSSVGNQDSGAFSSEYGYIRDTILTDLEKVRADKNRIDTLIEFQTQLLSAYAASGVWSGNQQASEYCADNVILCRYFPYTFDQIKWD